MILEGEDGEAKEGSVGFFCGVGFPLLSSEDPPANPANADSDVEETMAPREVTLFKTPIPSEALVFLGERGDSFSFSPPPSAEAPFLDTGLPSFERISFSLRIEDPLLGRTWRYGGIAAFLESSRYTESIGWGRFIVLASLLSPFLDTSSYL